MLSVLGIRLSAGSAVAPRHTVAPRHAAPLALTALVLLLAAPAATAQVPPVTPGFPNVAQTPGAVLSGLNAPQQGRTAIIAYHNGVLFTVPEVPSSQPGADFLVRTWDLADPTNPVELDTWGVTPMPINAHGYFKSGEYLVLGSNWPPEAPWTFQADGPGSVLRTTFPDLDCIGVRGCLFQPWFAGDTYWSYGEISGDATLSLNGVELASWDHLGLTGVIGHPFILGDLLIFASDQSRTGVATYDISDPTNPVLLDVLTTGGPGGYWPELWGGDGALYVVFPYRTNGNGFRVVDVTDPSELRFVTDKPLPGDASMYIQFQDEYAFMGGHKVDMRSLESVLFLDGANAVRPNDGGTGIDTSQFALPLGNLLITGGIGPDEGMAIWAHQADPDTRGPEVGYHVPQAGRTNYPVGAPISLLIHETLESATIVNGVSFIVRPLGGSAIDGRLTFSFDDVLTFTPTDPLLPDTTYEVVLPAGGIKDAAGNGIAATSFTFSTGGSVGGNNPPSVDSFDASAYPAPPGSMLTLQASVSDLDGGPLELRFDFGDGSPRTPWSAATSASHSYAAPGHYRVAVQVRDDAGALASDTFTVTVATPPAGPPPRNSSQLACDEAGRRVWAVNPDNGTVAAIDADSLAELFEVPACEDPRSIARSAAGELWVSCHDGDRIVVLGAAGGTLATIDTGYGSAPAGLVFSPAGDTAYVALSGSGLLARYDAAGRQLTGSLPLGPVGGGGPRALAITGDGSRLLVTRFLSPKDRGEVWDVDPAAMTLTRTLTIAKFGGEENRDGTASGRGTANYLTGIAIAPDGTTAWVTANKPNTERGLFFGPGGMGPDLDQDNSVRNVAVALDLTANETAGAIDIDNSDSASALAFSPLGDYLFVTLQGNSEVMALDALEIAQATGLGSLVTRLGAGLAPQAACTDAPSERLFVKNLMSRDVTAIDLADLLRRGSLTLPASQVATVASEALAPEVLLGKQHFYNAGDPRMSAEGYLSCASCHLDGGQDGRVWDFTGRGEGFRNTASLRGRAGMGHGNVHWSANFDEIQDFENDIRGAFGGAGFLSDVDFAATEPPLGPLKAGLSPDLDALAAYVASLGADSLPKSPHRDPDGTLTDSAVTGQALFASLGCASCHTPPTYTDSTVGVAPTLHDVGTLRTTSGGRLGGPLPGIDTPTLLGAWATPPYFHDGSAPQLEDVFTVAGGAVIQLEDGTPSGGADIVSNYVDLNNDDTVHHRAYVQLDNTGAALTLTGVDGGSGGIGALELRYSNGGAQAIEVTVNGGAPRTVQLESAGNSPSWRHTHWKRVRIEDVPLAAGASNTIVIATAAAFPNVSLDDIVVTTADDLAAALPHRQALVLTPTERTALVDYLRQLDGRPEVGVGPGVFSDGFETGDTTRWSIVVD